MKRFDIINLLIERLSLTSYLEVGAGTGACFHEVQCQKKLGIDIGWGTPPLNPWILRYTSKQLALELLQEAPTPDAARLFDCVFVDASHDAEDVLLDLNYISKIVMNNSVILLHDVSPPDERWAGRAQNPTVPGWCGNVWRAYLGAIHTKGIKGFSIDTDYGIGVLIVDNPNLLTSIELSQVDENEFFLNKQEYLKAIDFKYFIRQDRGGVE